MGRKHKADTSEEAKQPVQEMMGPLFSDHQALNPTRTSSTHTNTAIVISIRRDTTNMNWHKGGQYTNERSWTSQKRSARQKRLKRMARCTGKAPTTITDDGMAA